MSVRPLPPFAWQGLSCWRLLDTHFSDGHLFLTTWLRWRKDAAAPRTLHYVALCQQTATRAQLGHGLADAELQALAQELSTHWFGLDAGFHRLLLDQGRVVLTLCVGQPAHLLKQQQFHADAILVQSGPASDATPTDARSWSYKSLSACCQRGTVIHFMSRQDPHALSPQLRPCGIRLEQAPANGLAGQQTWLDAVFDPPWELHRRAAHPPLATASRHCAIIGAGLAGASTAAALARRGWQVTVVEQAGTAAAGASGLPVGLMVSHVSRDDCVLSRLSRAGVRLLLQQARQLLVHHQDWALSGVFERQIDGSPSLPDAWGASGLEWSVPDQCMADPADQAAQAGILHHPAAWLKPERLVQAWLNQPGIQLRTSTPVHALHWRNGQWDLCDANGNMVLRVPRVILANAGGMVPLVSQLATQYPDWSEQLHRIPATHNMRGLLSWASHAGSPGLNFPDKPVNGAGAIIANIPNHGDSAWYMGSSYQAQAQQERDDHSNHLDNLQHLRLLFPALAEQLAPQFENGRVHAWKGTRCISADRLPLVGPINPDASLWLCAAMGSRGLSLSMLCAELLASQWAGEPLPIETRLAQCLNATRAKLRA